MFLTALSWIMSGIALAGTLINAERNKWGFIFWIVSNTYMFITFWISGLHAQSVLFFIYFLLAIRGIISWSIKEKREKKSKANKMSLKDKLVGYLDKY